MSIKITTSGEVESSWGPVSIKWVPSTTNFGVSIGGVSASYQDGAWSGRLMGWGIADNADGSRDVSYKSGSITLNQHIDAQGNSSFSASFKSHAGGLATTETLTVSANPNGGLDYNWSGSVKGFDGKTIWEHTETGHVGVNDVAASFGGLAGQAVSALSGRQAQLDAIIDAATDGIDPYANQQYLASRAWQQPRRDPLTLDLDGDGLETTGIDPANPILFDHDGDGTSHATGWIRPDDGFLVLDRNGDGIINNGSELFGDSTPIQDANGTRMAVDGFDALAAQDSNHDGFVNAGDANWASLRVWRDADSDGVTDAGELHSLESLGIAGFQVAKTENSVGLANGNVLADLGHFIRADGSEGTIGNVTGAMADIDLVSNPFYREFGDVIPPTPETAALPDMKGSGALRDLREAATLSSDLAAKLATYAAATTQAAQMALVDGLIEAWSETTSFKTSIQQAAEHNFRLIYLVPGLSAQAYMDATHVGSGGGSGGPGQIGNDPQLLQMLEQQRAMTDLIAVLEKFNGLTFVNVEAGGVRTGGGQLVQIQQPDPNDPDPGGVIGTPPAFVSLSSAQIDSLLQATEALRESIYGSLVGQTRLLPYLEGITLVMDDTGVRADCTQLAARLDALWSTDPRNAIIDMVDLYRYERRPLQHAGYDGISQLQGWVGSLASDAPLRAELNALGVFMGASTAGSAKGDIYLGDAGANAFNGGEGNDAIRGGAGGDVLRGGGGNDLVEGNDGADHLEGHAGNDVLDGGAGNDALIGGVHDGYWGTYYGYGADTYLFGRGDGQDTVYDNDGTAGVIDKIVFKAGVLPSDVQVIRPSNSDLILKIAGTADQITVKNFFAGDGAGGWAVEEIRFAGEPDTVWTVSTVKALALLGTDAADYLEAYASDDVVHAGAGNDRVIGNAGADTLNGEDGGDTISGNAGNDSLSGGAGGDVLYGDDGNDTLDGGADGDNLQGGAGNDVLDGGSGNDMLVGGTHDGYWGTYYGHGADTYVFGRGDGQDTVYDNDTSAGVIDKIVFKAGVLPSDVQVIRPSNTDLVLKIAGTTDQITVKNFFTGDAEGGWAVEEVRFTDDATVWSLADVKAMAITGTAANDYLEGYASDDAINAGAGNDRVLGNAGADTLNGEDGSDTISGGAGNDAMAGGAGGDVLYGDDGDDLIDGGADGDNLQGGAGNDVLDGGSGDDMLMGGTHDGYWGTYYGHGADTYLFGRGDGQDVVYDNDGTAGVIDKIVFKAGVLPSDVQVIRPSNTDLVLRIFGTNDQITVKNFFTGDAAGGWAVEEVRFTDDATVWSLADVKAMAITGTAANDYLEGYATDDVINAGAGNDRVIGNAGADTLNGEDGGDTISGNAGNDTLSGAAGGDVLYGDDGDDLLDGGADGDNVQGGAGNDVLDGGAGNDTLMGGAHDGYWGTYYGSGADTYLFGRGDGQDTVYDDDGTAGVIDRIVFKAGVLPSDVQVVRPSNTDLVLKIVGTDDQITVKNYFTNEAAGSWAVEEIRFADDPSAVWTVATVKAMAITGTAANDYLEGYGSDDAISAGAGNDRVIGNAGADTLNGEDGGDTISGNAGNDTLAGGAGGDVLYGDDGNDNLYGGADGDNLQGGGGNDLLEGGAGNDTLIGGTHDGYWGTYYGYGADTYLFGRGDGQDTVYDDDGTAGVVDKILFKPGVLPGDVQVMRPNGGNDLVLRIPSTGDQVTVVNYFVNDASSSWVVEEIRFSDDPNTVWLVADLKRMVALNGTAGNDTMVGYATDDVMWGNAGNDSISGRAGNDTLNGEAGGDTLYGEAGNDVLNGGADNDNLQGGGDNDVLDGGAGNDMLVGGTHDGYWGTYYGYGADTYVFGRGDGQDTVYDNDGTAGVIDKIVFKAGVLPSDVQVVRPSNTDLVLKIAGTTDQITVKNFFTGDGAGGWTVEEIRFTDNATVWSVADVKALALVGTAAVDYLEGYASDDVINAGAGNDRVIGNAGADTLNGEDGGDTISGNAGNDMLNGGAGGDVLYGDDGDDSLYGAADGDNLQGGNGNDILDGGAGNDTMMGGVHDGYWGTYYGYGADTYLFGRGDGQDTVYDNDGTGGVIDKIVFKAGVLPSDVQVIRPSNTDLVLKIAGTTDQITVKNFFTGDATGGWAVEEIRFAGEPETVWTLSTIKAMALVGTAAGDYLEGYATDDVINAGAGNDRVIGNAGADTLNGEDGGDTISGNAGNDTLNGGAGGDVLYGDDGDDGLYGAADGDNLQGGNGNDMLDGGAGNDTMMGGVHDGYWGTYYGYGADTYLFGRGDGQDVVYDNDGTAGVVDKIVFKAGVLPSDVQVIRPSNTDLVLKIAGTTDQITVKNFFTSDAAGGWAVEEVRFTDDATVWSIADVKALALVGSAAADYLEGYASNDVINAGAGNDRVIGNAGGDTLNGEDGGDTISGNAGNDTLNGGAGGDVLYGDDGDDGLYGGADGDNLQGGSGSDVLDGGAGNDTLIGNYYDGYWGTYNGAGAETYLFGRGDGQDAVYDNDGTAGVIDKIVFKAGVLPSDVQVVRPSNTDLVLKIAGTTDQITVKNFFTGDAAGGWAVEEVRFTDDAAVWSLADIKAMALVGTAANDYLEGYASDDVINAGAGNDRVIGNAGADTLNGEDGGDTISGSAGNDTLNGGAGGDVLYGEDGNDSLNGGADGDNLQGGNGNDVLRGGAGNDTLIGSYYDGYWGSYNGAGADTYQFGRGDGQDTVYDNDGTAGVQDLLKFDADIANDQLWLRRVGSNLEVSIIGTADKVTIANWYSSTNWQVEALQVDDGKRLANTQVENLVQAMAAFAPPSAGQTTLPDNYRTALADVIAANWQ